MADDKDIDLLAVTLDLAFRAIKRGDLFELKELIVSEPRILRMHDFNGFTLLMRAAKSGHLETISVLLNSGADANERDRLGWSALRIAAHGKNMDAANVLLAHGATTDIFVIVAMNDYETVAHWLEKHPDLIFANDGLGAQPLHWAAEFGNIGVVELLLRLGAKATVTDSWGMTPLHATAQGALGGCVEIAMALLNSGAKVNAVDHGNDTPLIWAARHQSLDLVNLLLTRGAKVQVRNRLGNTSLHSAIARPNEDAINSMLIVERLLDAGADINARNENSETPLVVALEREQPQIAGLLRQRGGLE
jgi:ankyrin repeat protein